MLHVDVRLGPETLTVRELGVIVNPVGWQSYTTSVALRFVILFVTGSLAESV